MQVRVNMPTHQWFPQAYSKVHARRSERTIVRFSCLPAAYKAALIAQKVVTRLVVLVP